MHIYMLPTARELIRFISSTRVREIRVDEIMVEDFRVKANQG